jgi:hypothetical protein
MLKGKIIVEAMQDSFRRGSGVVVGLEGPEGRFYAGKIEFHEVDEGSLVSTPTVGAEYGRDFLQAALDCAWQMGMRPTRWHDETPAEIKATRAHLQDLRVLVFEKLGVELPKWPYEDKP